MILLGHIIESYPRLLKIRVIKFAKTFNHVFTTEVGVFSVTPKFVEVPTNKFVIPYQMKFE